MNDWKIKFYLMISVAFLISACSGKQKSQDLEATPRTPVVDSHILKKFNQGIEYLDAEKYQLSEKIFRELVIEHPASQFHWISMYNLGASYEGLQKCKEAGRAYRKVAQASMEKYPRLEAQALFRMSFAYSCLGFDEKAIAALLDARRRSDLLKEEVAMAEIPARLAAAYARIGNNSKAEEYFNIAKLGVQKLKEKHRNRRAVRDILAKTLFLMGRMVPIEKRAQVDSLEYLATLQHLQPYLLEAAELNSKAWSPQAAKEIDQAYENIWSLVKNVPALKTKDREFVDHKKMQFRFKIISEALTNLKMLRADFRPGLKDNPYVDELKHVLDEKELLFNQYLAENAIINPLSDQAKKNQGLKRQGRTRGSSDLEDEAKKRMALPEKEKGKNQ